MKLPLMNSINNTINGLASSLFLNVGLTSVAEKLDPVNGRLDKASNTDMSGKSVASCVWTCNFTPEAGQ
ncbi:MAG: hypothetical protein HYV75_04430 [Opitutae bacterium]|nr:hypothetical protein [Opitutae bacterium]